jgi:hypothetical protein
MPHEQVPLLDARLELTQHLTADERAELAGMSLPVVVTDPGPLDLDGLLARHHAFGATVIDGMVMSSLRVGEQTGIHLLGPGDLLVPRSESWTTWLSEVGFRTAAPVHLGLFGNDLLAAAYRWPRLIQGLYRSIGEQLQRLTAQLVICQLPRVEDRVVAMLWLLAESWGHVTSGGVRLPLALTHETLGALIGARRPTVTLALRKLTDEGVLIAQDSGWLLLHPPPEPASGSPKIIPVQLTDLSAGRWASAPGGVPVPDISVAYAELRETVRRLREQHRTDAEDTRERLRRVRNDRVRMMALRKRIAQDVLRRRRPPSS